MSEFIQAMGAEHIDQRRLKIIVDNMQNNGGMPVLYTKPGNKLLDKYGVRYARQYELALYVGEIKYDGYSYICNCGKFYSRRLSTAKGNEGRPVEKSGHLPHLAQIFEKLAFAGIELDVHGELCFPNGTSDDVTKIMGCAPDEAVRRQEKSGWLDYKLIDIRRWNGHILINEPYYIRRAILEYVYETYLIRYDNIHISDVIFEPVSAFKRVVAGGGEGLVLKNTKSLYVPGKKPMDHWIKCKKKVTFEAVIMGYNDGTGKNKTLFGSIEFGLYINIELVPMGNVSSGVNDEIRNKIASNPEYYIGQVIELEAMQENKSSFRNPVFKRLRPDKDKSECTLKSIRPVLDILGCYHG